MNFTDDTPLPEAAVPLDIDGDDELIVVPGEWPERYTTQDRADVAAIVSWLNKNHQTQAFLAGLARLNASTFNGILKGRYPSSPSRFLGQAMDAIQSYEDRNVNKEVPFVEGVSVYRLAVSVYHRARTYKNIGVFVSNVGTGKTRSATEYKARAGNTYLVECLPSFGVQALLDELCGQLDLTREVRGMGHEKKAGKLINALRNTESLVIIDEAEKMQQDALEYVRRLRDKARIGVVLQGAPDLLLLIKPEHGRFNQIRSRIGFWPDTVSSISRRDADAIASAAFSDIEGLDQASLDAMWAVGGGSARVLVESLIPAIRDYGLRKGRKLDPALVRQIAVEALKIPMKPIKDGAA